MALLLALVVGVFSASPFGEQEVAYAQTGPSLSNLVLTVTNAADDKVLTDLSPEFDSDKTSYTRRASNAVEQITVAATIETGSTLGAITPADADTNESGHQVNLSVGRTTIRVPVTLDGSSRTYTVVVTRVSSTASSDTKLSRVSLSNVMLSPAFDPDKRTGYADRVPNSVSLTTVTANAANSGANADIGSTSTAPSDPVTASNFDGATMADSANVVSLPEGATYILIRVTAADVETEGYYAVAVTRAAEDASAIATLGALSLADPDSDAAINTFPAFADTRTAYTASVPYTVRKATVTATVTTASDATRVITSNMDDTIATEGDAANDVDLAVGANVITVKVDAENAIATKTYTVTVTRASSTASTDANLSSLSLSRVTLSPAFDPGKATYTALVPNSVGLTTVGATAADSGAVVNITAVHASGADSVIDSANVVTLSDTEETNITIAVTAADGVNSKSYTVAVTRAAEDASAVATLGALSLADPDSDAAIAISPAFAADKTAYTASVPYTVRKATVTATVTTASDATRVITSNMDDTIATEGDAANDVDLAVGANVITVKVDAENAIATKTYTVTVTRASSTASADANLSNLSLSRVTLSPAFDPGKATYTALVPNSVSVTTVRTTAADSGAVVNITAVHASGTDSVIDSANVVTLSDTEETNITIAVTAADGVNSKSYTVDVTRAGLNASDDSSLTTLTLETDATITPANTDDLYLNMPFIPGRTEYTTTAARAQSSIIVATTPATGAMVMVTSDMDDEVKRYRIEPTDAATESADDFIVDLKHGPNVITITVTAENAVTMQTYTVTVTRTGAGDSSLYSLSLSGITLDPAFAAATTAYMSAETLASDATMTTVTALANHGGASVAISSDRDDDIGDDNVVDLDPGRNVITVMVTAEDGASQTYTVTVNVAMGDTLLDSYDANDNGRIDKSEALTAIEDYIFGGILTKDQALEVIALYIFG